MLFSDPVCVTLLPPARLVMPQDRGRSLSLPGARLHELTLLVSRLRGEHGVRWEAWETAGFLHPGAGPGKCAPNGLLIPGDESNQLVRSNCFGRVVGVPAPLGAWMW